MGKASPDSAAVADLVMRDMRDGCLQQRMRRRQPPIGVAIRFGLVSKIVMTLSGRCRLPRSFSGPYYFLEQLGLCPYTPHSLASSSR